LQLLHGVIDSPDIPLNVSRSYLQSDANVKKINTYITKKVGDKLHELFKQDRPSFEMKWRDLGVFVKYGMVSDDDFQKRAMNFALLENTNGEHYLIEDYKEKIKANQTDKHNKLVCIYTHDPEVHNALIKAANNRGYDVLLLNSVLDNHWMQHLEYRAGTDMLFVRLDSDALDKLVQKDESRESALSETEQNTLKSLFEKSVQDMPGIRVELHAGTPDELPVHITKPEFMRRMQEMQTLHGMGLDGMPETYNVVVNTNHPVMAGKLLQLESESGQQEMARYLYEIALLRQGMLRGAALTDFVEKTLEKL
jgi:molecular chaperone HtpG